MKIKLDENVPLRVAPVLRNLGHDVHTTPEEELAGHTDEEIWQAAQRERRLLVTQDLDLADARQLTGIHHGVVVIRLDFPNGLDICNRIEEVFRTSDIAVWAGCVVVISEEKIRIRRTH